MRSPGSFSKSTGATARGLKRWEGREVCELQRKPQPSKTAEDGTIIPRSLARLFLSHKPLFTAVVDVITGNRERLSPTKLHVNILRRDAGKKSRVLGDLVALPRPSQKLPTSTHCQRTARYFCRCGARNAIRTFPKYDKVSPRCHDLRRQVRLCRTNAKLV